MLHASNFAIHSRASRCASVTWAGFLRLDDPRTSTEQGTHPVCHRGTFQISHPIGDSGPVSSMPPRRTGPTIIRVDCDDNRRSHSHGATIGCQRPLLSTSSTLKPTRGHHRGLRWRVLCGGREPGLRPNGYCGSINSASRTFPVIDLIILPQSSHGVGVFIR